MKLKDKVAIVTGGTSGGNTKNTISYYAGLNMLTGLEG